MENIIVNEKKELKDKLLRGGYILLFAIFYSIAEVVLSAIVIFQFLHTLIKDDINTRLKVFSSQINIYVYDILQYVTYNSEVKPYPFTEWKKK